MITTQVVFEITRSSVVISKVASKVEIVVGAEVLAADSINVIHVTGACDVHFAQTYQFLWLIFIVSPTGLDGGGGHQPWWVA
jgi:hypothetical protein